MKPNKTPEAAMLPGGTPENSTEIVSSTNSQGRGPPGHDAEETSAWSIGQLALGSKKAIGTKEAKMPLGSVTNLLEGELALVPSTSNRVLLEGQMALVPSTSNGVQGVYSPVRNSTRTGRYTIGAHFSGTAQPSNGEGSTSMLNGSRSQEQETHSSQAPCGPDGMKPKGSKAVKTDPIFLLLTMWRNKQTIANKKAKKFAKKQSGGDSQGGGGTVPHNVIEPAVWHLPGDGRRGDVSPGLIVCSNSATRERGETQFIHQRGGLKDKKRKKPAPLAVSSEDPGERGEMVVGSEDDDANSQVEPSAANHTCYGQKLRDVRFQCLLGWQQEEQSPFTRVREIVMIPEIIELLHA
uniref:Uncharacterized protein n=1 Tax=Romanomermis culicivorax TaxID=13658 RepID=A0A915JAU8_ROMCU